MNNCMNRRFIGIILSGIIIFSVGGCSANSTEDLPDELKLPNSERKYKSSEIFYLQIYQEICYNIITQ